MSLSDLTFETATIRAGKSSFDVAGLSLADLTVLLTQHRDEFLAAVDLFQKHEADPSTFALELCRLLPTLVASGVALAAGEPSMAGKVAKLPAPVQLDAVMAVGRMTFTDPLALPNFIANLTGLLGGVGTLARGATLSPGSAT